MQTFPALKGKWQISQGGGAEPAWRKDGRELFYLGSDGKLRAVAVRTDPDFEAVGATMELFEPHIPVRFAPYRSNYDVSDDGQRFVVNTAIEGTRQRSISVVLDWASALRNMTRS